MKVVWCQWPDLRVPQGFSVNATQIDQLTEYELSQIEILIPTYMGGRAALESIEKMPNLKIVQLLMAGFEDAIPFMRSPIRLFNARGVHDYSTSELTLTFLLAHFTGLVKNLEDQRNAYWRSGQRGSLYGKEIAIIGAGSVGERIAHLLKEFNVNITLYASRPRSGVLGIDSLDSTIGKFDVVITIVPLTESTHHLIGAKQLASMKDGALLVNVARGPVVDTYALVKELETGRIFAALDVTDPEPLPREHPLWRLPNVIITPHVGGNSTAFEPQARQFLYSQLSALASTGNPLNEIDWQR